MKEYLWTYLWNIPIYSLQWIFEIRSSYHLMNQKFSNKILYCLQNDRVFQFYFELNFPQINTNEIEFNFFSIHENKVKWSDSALWTREPLDTNCRFQLKWMTIIEKTTKEIKFLFFFLTNQRILNQMNENFFGKHFNCNVIHMRNILRNDSIYYQINWISHKFKNIYIHSQRFHRISKWLDT